MSSDDSNPPQSLPEGMGFTAVDTISAADEPPDDILSCILRHEEAGIPLVIRGLNVDPNWSPLRGLDPLEGHGDDGHQPPGRFGERPAIAERQSDLDRVIS